MQRAAERVEAQTQDLKRAAGNVGNLAGSPDEVGAKRLRSFVDRIERLEEEKAGIAADIRDIYAEARGTGYDVKALRKLIAMRKQEIEERREQAELLQLYMHALGMDT